MDPFGQPPKQAQQQAQPSSSSTPSPSTTPTSRCRQNTMSQVPGKSSSGELASKAMANAKSFEGRRSARGSKDSLTLKPAARQTPSPVPVLNHSEELLKTLTAEFETLRNIIMCKICYGLLYEPYTTFCGHTYCYSCLCKSFRPGTSQSCPECRTILSNAPAPAFLVRELTHTFIKRAELLPQGETIELHIKWQKEHADTIQRDKSNTDRRTGGLWKGFFRPRPRPRRAFRDAEDGVDRCPYCQWELEDGMCQRCGLPFDENGTGTWEFSDMDEVSEHDMNSELGGYDIEVDMDEDEDDDLMDEDGNMFDGDLDDWLEEYGHPLGHRDHSYAIRRYLQGDLPPHMHPQNVRPRAAHSAAGSRRRSYAASLASEMADSEMAIVEEEDEDADEDDSSMNDFIDDDEIPNSQPSSSASDSLSVVRAGNSRVSDNMDGSEDDEPPIPSGRRRQHRAQPQSRLPSSNHRAAPYPERRNLTALNLSAGIVEAADTPSGSDEDEGPIAPARRQYRSSQAQRQQSSGAPSGIQGERAQPGVPSASAQVSEPSTPPPRPRNPSMELGEPFPRPAQIRSTSVGTSVQPEAFQGITQSQEHVAPPSLGYAPLGGGLGLHDDELDDGDESDGGRTTVGWEPITTSIERMRNAGSLTPTADRPNPLNRPPSRAGSTSFPLGTRGIRRRSSVLSVSTVNYEDNDADDDISDGDPDSEVEINTSALRQQTSNLRQRNTAQQPMFGINNTQPQPFSDNFDVDSDDTDISPMPIRRGQQIRRQEEYDPRISLLFAQHERDVRDVDYHDPVTRNDIEQLRAIARTPLARPRSTVNRNRLPSIPSQGVPLNTPGQAARTSQINHTNPRASRSNLGDGNHTPLASPNGRSTVERPLPSSGRTLMNDSTRAPAPPNREVLNSSAMPSSIHSSPQNIARQVPQYATSLTTSPTSVGHAGDSIERPMSRMSSRPSSAAGRRGNPAWAPFSPPQFTMGPGLNAARTWQISRNPFMNPGAVRPRQSTQRLRDQSSTATLRPRSSRILRNQPSQISIREQNSQAQQMRPQASRIQLRSQPSSHRLQSQPSVRALRAAEVVLAAEQQYAASNASTNFRRYASPFGESNTSDRVNEQVNRRTQQPENNPFTRRYRQSVPMSSNVSSSGATHMTQASTPTRSLSSSTSGAPFHQNTSGPQPQSPGIGRRRSNRALATVNANTSAGASAPPSVLQNANTGYMRARIGQSPGMSSQESYFSPTMARRGS